jgi:hypothetical protein
VYPIRPEADQSQETKQEGRNHLDAFEVDLAEHEEIILWMADRHNNECYRDVSSTIPQVTELN